MVRSLYSGSRVTELTGRDFVGKKLKKSHINNGGAIVLFYANWCGHCKDMAPEYRRLAVASPIPVLAVESKNEDVMKKFGIQGFPTIKFANSAGTLSRYDGSRNLHGLLNQACMKASVCKLPK